MQLNWPAGLAATGCAHCAWLADAAGLQRGAGHARRKRAGHCSPWGRWHHESCALSGGCCPAVQQRVAVDSCLVRPVKGIGWLARHSSNSRSTLPTLLTARLGAKQLQLEIWSKQSRHSKRRAALSKSLLVPRQSVQCMQMQFDALGKLLCCSRTNPHAKRHTFLCYVPAC